MSIITDFKEFKKVIFSTLTSKVQDKLETEHENISNSLFKTVMDSDINTDEKIEITK